MFYLRSTCDFLWPTCDLHVGLDKVIFHCVYKWNLFLLFAGSQLLKRFWGTHCALSFSVCVAQVQMCSLDLVFEAKLQEKQEAQSNFQSSKFRLVANPLVSVSSLQTAMTKFLVSKGDKRLWSLIAPPPGCPQSYGWHTSPQGEWLAKVASLLYELVLVAENTKINSKKLSSALDAMEKNKDIELASCRKETAQDVKDKIDLTLRILLAMVRNIKANSALKSKVYRMVPKNDQLRIDILLEKIVLPPELMGGMVVEEEEKEPVPEVIPPEASTWQMVPFTKPEEKVQPLVPYDGKKSSTAASSGCRLQPTPNIFTMIMGKPAEEMKKLKPTFLEALKTLSDDDFIDQSLAWHATLPPRNKPRNLAYQEKLNRMTDDELIEHLDSWEPDMVKGKDKKTQQKTKGKVKTPKAKTAAKKVKKTKGKKKEEEKEKKIQKVQVHQPSLQVPEEDQVQVQKSHFEIPEDQTIYNFESKVYGSCKMECYTNKSYIRRFDPESGKLKNILGSCLQGFHAKVVRGMVAAVAAGQSIEQLHELRKVLMDQMPKDVD